MSDLPPIYYDVVNKEYQGQNRYFCYKTRQWRLENPWILALPKFSEPGQPCYLHMPIPRYKTKDYLTNKME